MQAVYWIISISVNIRQFSIFSSISKTKYNLYNNEKIDVLNSVHFFISIILTNYQKNIPY